MNKASAIAAEIDKQIEILHRCRSVFPRLDNSLVGQTEFRAPGYYQQLGLDVSVKLSSPMTAEFIDGLFDLGHWINENFVVRLWSILESNGIKTVNQELDNWRDVELVRRLRNKIGHGSGNYDPNDKDKKKLFDSIVDYYKVPQGYSYFDVEKYPIGIKQVLVPMAHGCKTYAAAYLAVKKGG